MKDLQDIIYGTLLGDAGITVTSGKYFNYKHIAKDRRYLEWQSRFLEKHGIGNYIGIANKINKIYHLGVYINSKNNRFLDSLHNRWYKKKASRNVKFVPKDIEITPTILFHWYLGDGSLIRQKDNNRIPRIVLSTNNFSRQDIDFLINKLKGIGLNFYPILCFSGFKDGAKSGYVLISRTNEGTPFRFFKMIGFDCPKEIRECFTGNKGRGSKRHYFKDKWPTKEDWLRILSNVEGIGKIIRERREEINMNREKVANYVGVKKKHIERIEGSRRYPSMDVFRKLLNILDINATCLLKELGK